MKRILFMLAATLLISFTLAADCIPNPDPPEDDPYHSHEPVIIILD